MATMASSSLHSLLFVIFLATMLLLTPQVQADEEDDLFQGINAYRASINLSSLTKNTNAECLAEKIADQFKQPCTNDTGSNTILGNEPQFPNFPDFLKKCHLNITNTKDGVIMPACVPSLDQSLVLTNFTQSQYNAYLNATEYTGVGIGSENNWIVVILSTNTTDGSFVPASASSTDNSAALVPKLRLIYLFFSLFSCFFLVNFS